MRSWPALLLASLLLGQEAPPGIKPASTELAQHLRIRAVLMTPQAMLRAMVAMDRAQRDQPGAVVEVLGYDDEKALRLLALAAAQHVRLAFDPMTMEGHRNLYAFMHQDPNRPSAVPPAPMLAGAKVARSEDKWLR